MKYITLLKNKGLKYFISSIRKEARKKIFIFLIKIIYRGSDKETYSQYREDLLIDMLIGYKKFGTYIDVGANNPVLLSNTYKFYKRDWRGVNIDPDSSIIKVFLKERLNDINLNVGIGKEEAEITFYNFEIDTLSTFSESSALELQKRGVKLLQREKVKVLTLNEVFSMLKTNYVDFVSIDTEGYDMQVLQGNDWIKNRPKVVCIEDESGREYDVFFKNVFYKKVCFNGLNSFFIDNLQT